MKISGIYKIENPKGRIYIGQSIDIYKRWTDHKYIYDTKPLTILQNSIKKYGYKNHKFMIIEKCKINLLNKREIFWIKHYKSNKIQFPFGLGMNLTIGGENPPIIIGKKFTEKSKENIGIKNKHNFAQKRIAGIKQFDLNGNLVKEWLDTSDFNKNQEFLYFQVRKVCEGKKLKYKSFIWRFPNDSFDKHNYKQEKKKKQLLTKEQLKEIYKIIAKKKIGNKFSETTKTKMSVSQKTRWTDEKRKILSLKLKGRKAPWKKESQSKDLIEKRMSKIRKPILQFDLNNVFIKEYPSYISLEINKEFNQEYVRAVIKRKKESYKGFIWKLKMDNGTTKN